VLRAIPERACFGKLFGGVFGLFSFGLSFRHGIRERGVARQSSSARNTLEVTARFKAIEQDITISFGDTQGGLVAATLRLADGARSLPTVVAPRPTKCVRDRTGVHYLTSRECFGNPHFSLLVECSAQLTSACLLVSELR
jgi:hypothetical protein